jgi:hypothetical protein
MRRLFLLLAFASVASADINSAYWSDASYINGVYGQSPAAYQCGALLASVCGAIPTNGVVDTDPNANVANYFRTGDFIPGAETAYNGVLLGDLSGAISLTATFSISDSLLSPGESLANADIVGEDYPGQGPNGGLRLMFMGGYLADGVTPNEWWSNPTSASLTSMNNGQDVTLTVNFDPSQWSNYNGQVGTSDAADFYGALAGVTKLGISFGSGYFFSDGFAFSGGGTADIELDSIAVAQEASVPEPGQIILLLTMLAGLTGCLALTRRLRRA